MADLLSSLILPSSPRSSQESFRSVASQADTSSSSLAKAQSTSTTFSASAAFQQAGLPVYDIDHYLKENANLRATSSNSKSLSQRPAQIANGTAEPVHLGTKTSYFVAALNTQCQLKGFVPVFEIEGDASNADFGCVLKLRDVEVTSDQRYPSKKEARERLAEKGLEVVKGIEAKKGESGAAAEPGKNWVGLLHGESMDPCLSF